MNKLVDLQHVTKTFPAEKSLFGRPSRFVHAVNDVSFSVVEGETFSIVGESGCGKSTTARLINRLIEPEKGDIFFDGQNITRLNQNQMRPLRKEIQMIFQDPAGSLNPRMKVWQLIEEPLLIHTQLSPEERRQKVDELLQVVGLSPRHADRYPHEFSGGQKQRIGIARALTVHPRLLIADEPISALDVSIQAQVLNLLHRLQEEYHLTIVFISHDLSVVEMISDRVGVMYLGSMVEEAPKELLYSHPAHPYTQALLAAVPLPDPKVKPSDTLLEGDIPSNIQLPEGCPFASRCRFCQPQCLQKKPQRQEIEPGHFVACHLFHS